MKVTTKTKSKVINFDEPIKILLFFKIGSKGR